MTDGFIWPFLSGIAVAAVIGVFAWSLRKRHEHGGWYLLLTSKWRERRRRLAEKRELDERIAREAPLWEAQQEFVAKASLLPSIISAPKGTYHHLEWKRRIADCRRAVCHYLRLGAGDLGAGGGRVRDIDKYVPYSGGTFNIFISKISHPQGGLNYEIVIRWSHYQVRRFGDHGDPSDWRKILFFRISDSDAASMGISVDDLDETC